MPMVYTVTDGDQLLTNGTANTETETFFVKPGTRNVALQAFLAIGSRAGGVADVMHGTSIAFRIVKWATASTSGTSITPRPRDPGMQAAKQTAASRPTSGSTRTNHMVFGGNNTGPAGWVALTRDSCLVSEGGSSESISCLDISGGTGQPFYYCAETVE